MTGMSQSMKKPDFGRISAIRRFQGQNRTELDPLTLVSGLQKQCRKQTSQGTIEASMFKNKTGPARNRSRAEYLLYALAALVSWALIYSCVLWFKR